MNLTITDIFKPRYFATLLLVLFCIRYIPLETRAGPSMIKTIVSGVSIIVILIYAPQPSKATFWGGIYFLTILFSALAHPLSFRWSTILYLLSFILTFTCFYNLVWVKRVFTIDYFLKLVKYLLYAYFITLLIQQSFLLVGIKLFSPINLCQILNRGIGANSLSGEPSTAARIMTILFYAYLKCSEYKQNETVTIKQLFNSENKLLTYGYIWSVITMGSGTAFVCAAVLSLYFIKPKQLLYIIPVYTLAFWGLSNSDNKSFNRAANIFDATMTGDESVVRETDTSAAVRITPMLNTINNLDIMDADTWYGHGVDWSNRPDIKRSKYRMAGDIGDYGLIAYILSIIFVFSCSINFFSLATVMYFIGIGGGTGNIAYFWGILMVFSTIKYFYDNRYNDFIYEDDEITD